MLVVIYSERPSLQHKISETRLVILWLDIWGPNFVQMLEQDHSALNDLKSPSISRPPWGLYSASNVTYSADAIVSAGCCLLQGGLKTFPTACRSSMRRGRLIAQNRPLVELVRPCSFHREHASVRHRTCSRAASRQDFVPEALKVRIARFPRNYTFCSNVTHPAHGGARVLPAHYMRMATRSPIRAREIHPQTPSRSTKERNTQVGILLLCGTHGVRMKHIPFASPHFQLNESLLLTGSRAVAYYYVVEFHPALITKVVCLQIQGQRGHMRAHRACTIGNTTHRRSIPGEGYTRHSLERSLAAQRLTEQPSADWW